MDATNLPKILPKSKFLAEVAPFVADITLLESNTFYWSPKRKTIAYVDSLLSTSAGQWSLLHEIAHAHLGHVTYSTDFELLKLEVAAWNKAEGLSRDIGQQIDPDHVQDCIDTYRDWLHQRSTCPTCGSVGLQHTPKEYRCHNCLSIWEVSESRFCRPYRRKVHTTAHKKSPDSVNQATFR